MGAVRRAAGSLESVIDSILERRTGLRRWAEAHHHSHTALDFLTAVIPVPVLMGAWGGVGYGLGGRAGAATGAGLGLVAASILAWVVHRSRIR